MNVDMTPLFAAFMIGFLGSTHCVGMCGGLVGLFSFSLPKNDVQTARFYYVIFNIGRIFSYALIGCIFGLVGFALGETFGKESATILRGIAAGLLILLGMSLLFPVFAMQWIEGLGKNVWKRIQPLTKNFFPVQTFPQAFFLGMIWGWLPCGLVYSTLAFAISTTSWYQSGLTMFAFGVGTLPMLLSVGIFANQVRQWLQKSWMRLIASVGLIMVGIWNLYVLYGADHADHHHHHANQVLLQEL